jgi:hypothetical protein
MHGNVTGLLFTYGLFNDVVSRMIMNWKECGKKPVLGYLRLAWRD